MRSVFVLLAAVSMFSACKKAALATAPATTVRVTLAGSWTGCLAEPGASCAPVAMTLSDSVLTDSTAAVTGIGNWGDNVTIHGKLVDSTVSLDASAVGVLQGWSFTGEVTGDSLTGKMTIPGDGSLYQATFTRSP